MRKSNICVRDKLQLFICSIYNDMKVRKFDCLFDCKRRIKYYKIMKLLDDVKTILSKPQPHQEINKEDAPPQTVLIVEDEPILLEMYRDKFMHVGYNVISAENGKIGLEKALAKKPDIILLDLMMPIMNGTTMLRRLREFPKFKKLPVIILTNAGEVDNMREALLFNNANEFLIKSNVNVEDVVKRVKFWLPTLVS
jgi:CheY-like chemotaxis protein